MLRDLRDRLRTWRCRLMGHRIHARIAGPINRRFLVECRHCGHAVEVRPDEGIRFRRDP